MFARKVQNGTEEASDEVASVGKKPIKLQLLLKQSNLQLSSHKLQ